MIFDAHFHIIDPRFPLVENDGYLPPIFNIGDYRIASSPYSITGGAIVSGSFQAFDQKYLLHALKKLGPSFVGVTQIPVSSSDEEIITLNRAGVRAVRFNLKRGGSAGIEDLEALALRVHRLVNWHVELYVDSRDLGGVFERLAKLPKVVIDHFGLSKQGLPLLLKLVEKGVYVKATGFGRIDFDPAEVIKNICDINENALIFGTDFPSTRAPRPFEAEDLEIFQRTLSERQVHKVLFQNAVNLYCPADYLTF